MQNAQVTHTWADVVYDGIYSGALAGSIVALFLLFVDTLNGHPLFTPSLMGAVLFEGVPATSVTSVHLDMVAYYSIVHFGAFGVLGFVVSFLVHEAELHTRHPGEVLGVLFVVFEGGFFITAHLLMPGVTEVVGAFRLFVVNLLAAGTMSLFIVAGHSPETWQRLKHAAHIR